MRRRVLRTISVGVALSAFAAAGASGSAGPGPPVIQGWDGVRAGAVRYVTVPAGGQTAIEAIRVRDGRVVRYGEVRGTWGVPQVAYDGTTGGLSRDGRTLVLGQIPGGVQLRASSSFALVAVKQFRLIGVVRLKGDFSFDALSPDGARLYLIQHLSANDVTRYQVRAYDLETRRLLPGVVAAKGETDMRGLPLARVASRDGVWAYTLYGGMPREAFVHALNTARAQAFCIDLPWRGTATNVSKLRLVVNGTRLVIRRPGYRAAAVVDRGTFRVLSSVREP